MLSLSSKVSPVQFLSCKDTNLDNREEIKHYTMSHNFNFFIEVYALEILHFNKIKLFCYLSFETMSHSIGQTGLELIMYPRKVFNN